MQPSRLRGGGGGGGRAAHDVRALHQRDLPHAHPPLRVLRLALRRGRLPHPCPGRSPFRWRLYASIPRVEYLSGYTSAELYARTCVLQEAFKALRRAFPWPFEGLLGW